MKYILLLVTALCLQGCFIKYVYVPVAVCPYVDVPKKEALKIKSVPDNGDTKEILRAFAYDIIYLTSYSDQLLLLLEAYNTKTVSFGK